MVKIVPKAIEELEDNKVKCCINCIHFKVLKGQCVFNATEYDFMKARCTNELSRFYNRPVCLKVFKEIGKYKGRAECPFFEGVDDDV